MDKEIIDNLMFMPLDMPTPPKDYMEELLAIPYDVLFRDHFRKTNLMPLYVDANEPGKYVWTEFSDHCPSMREWIKENLLPLTGDTKIVWIVTPAGDGLPAHIDCSPEMFDTLQHKVRYVLQGNVSDLVFMDDNGNNVSPAKELPDVPFVMSGRWPHYMDNTSSETKYTLAIGAPWDASHDDQAYVELFERSYEKYKDYYISLDDVTLPDNWEELFEDVNYSPRDKLDGYYGNK